MADSSVAGSCKIKPAKATQGLSTLSRCQCWGDDTQCRVVAGGEKCLLILEVNREHSDKLPHLKMTTTLGKMKTMLTRVTDVKWHPRRVERIATASTSGVVVIWDVNTKQPTALKRTDDPSVSTEHTRMVKRVAWDAVNDSLLLSCSQDGTIKLWDMRTYHETSPVTFRLNHAEGQAPCVKDIEVDPFDPNSFACSTDESAEILYWDIRMHEGPKMRISASSESSGKGAINSINFHPTKRGFLAAGSKDRTVRLWDLHSDAAARPVVEIQTLASVSRVAWRPNNFQVQNRHSPSSVPGSPSANRWGRLPASEPVAQHDDFFSRSSRHTHQIAEVSLSPLEVKLNIWDFTAPLLPLCAVKAPHDEPITDMEWWDASGEVILSCSKDGSFTASLIRRAYVQAAHLCTTAVVWGPHDMLAYHNNPLNFPEAGRVRGVLPPNLVKSLSSAAPWDPSFKQQQLTESVVRSKYFGNDAAAAEPKKTASTDGSPRMSPLHAEPWASRRDSTHSLAFSQAGGQATLSDPNLRDPGKDRAACRTTPMPDLDPRQAPLLQTPSAPPNPVVPKKRQGFTLFGRKRSHSVTVSPDQQQPPASPAATPIINSHFCLNSDDGRVLQSFASAPASLQGEVSGPVYCTTVNIRKPSRGRRHADDFSALAKSYALTAETAFDQCLRNTRAAAERSQELEAVWQFATQLLVLAEETASSNSSPAASRAAETAGPRLSQQSSARTLRQQQQQQAAAHIGFSQAGFRQSVESNGNSTASNLTTPHSVGGPTFSPTTGLQGRGSSPSMASGPHHHRPAKEAAAAAAAAGLSPMSLKPPPGQLFTSHPPPPGAALLAPPPPLPPHRAGARGEADRAVSLADSANSDAMSSSPVSSSTLQNQAVHHWASSNGPAAQTAQTAPFVIRGVPAMHSSLSSSAKAPAAAEKDGLGSYTFPTDADEKHQPPQPGGRAAAPAREPTPSQHSAGSATAAAKGAAIAIAEQAAKAEPAKPVVGAPGEAGGKVVHDVVRCHSSVDLELASSEEGESVTNVNEPDGSQLRQRPAVGSPEVQMVDLVNEEEEESDEEACSLVLHNLNRTNRSVGSAQEEFLVPSPPAGIDSRDALDPFLASLFMSVIESLLEVGDVQTVATLIVSVVRASPPIFEAQAYNTRGCEWFMSYYELLTSADLIVTAAALIKHCPFQKVASMSTAGTQVQGKCTVCQNDDYTKSIAKTTTEQQKNCCQQARKCCVCLIPVKGLYMWSRICGHGGHLRCLRRWLNCHRTCPNPDCGKDAAFAY